MAFYIMLSGAFLVWGADIYKMVFAGEQSMFVSGNLNLPQTVGMIMAFGGFCVWYIAEEIRIERSLRLPPVQ